MKGQHVKRSRARLPSWSWVALGLISVVIVATARLWWPVGHEVAAGSPRLVVDRTEVNLGKRRYDTPAKAAFTLSNVGDSVLTILEEPTVAVVKGC
jgi:hypothetical protein